MARFYLIATALIVAIGSIVFARHLATLRDFEVRGTPRPGQTPTVTRGSGAHAPQPAATFSGEGAWVMSALPECFDQQKSVIGASDLLASKIPPASERLRAGTVLRWANCSVRVGAHDVLIARGGDRLRVPPESALYRRGDTLTLVWESAFGRTEIRVYDRGNRAR